MSWEIEEEEVHKVLALPARDRAVIFFQLVADWEEAWGLKDATDWIVAKDADALPLWPHAAFATACARGPWAGAVPAAISLDDLLTDLLALLAEEGLRVAVFPSPEGAGVLLSPAELRAGLERELELGTDR